MSKGWGRMGSSRRISVVTEDTVCVPAAVRYRAAIQPCLPSGAVTSYQSALVLFSSVTFLPLA